MINVFLDTEFTHLQEPLTPEPAGLISIGCVTEKSGKTFYAENADFQLELCSKFVCETVLPLLEGGDASMPYSMIARRLRTWVESFTEPVKFWSDAPYWDWMHVRHMFETHGWPENLRRECTHLMFASPIQNIRLKNGVADAFRSFNPALRRHHALDDAIANRHGFRVAVRRQY